MASISRKCACFAVRLSRRPLSALWARSVSPCASMKFSTLHCCYQSTSSQSFSCLGDNGGQNIYREGRESRFGINGTSVVVKTLQVNPSKSGGVGRRVTERWITTEALEELHWSEMDTAEFVKVLKKGELRLFDIREPEELEKNGHLPGSVNLPFSQLEQALEMSPGVFQERYGVPKPSKEDVNIVLHCRAGVRSHQAVELAYLMGYRFRHYIRGWLGWCNYLQEKEKS